MTQTITPSMTINEAVRQFPNTMKVFSRHGLDTCCGGHQKIGDSAKSAGADIGRLLADLEAVAQGGQSK